MTSDFAHKSCLHRAIAGGGHRGRVGPGRSACQGRRRRHHRQVVHQSQLLRLKRPAAEIIIGNPSDRRRLGSVRQTLW